jgi:3'-phosphoadenosine 5'-phosphosulfate sulfotransferase (PAPS reductase)/FAD synthetase
MTGPDLEARIGGQRLNPYRLPDGNVQIAFSGGRTSAYMLRQILDVNNGLPDRAIVTFQNTGREMPETLDFVAEVGAQWGVNIIWLEYRPASPFFDIVSHNSASRNGEPFAALIEKRKFLPNQNMRFCTTELKIRVAARYFRSLGWDYWTNAVGIRADEARRLKPEGERGKDRWSTWQPLAHAGVSKRDVQGFWESQAFDLRLPNVGGNCWLGNCDGCFLKSESNIAAFTRDYPERAVWWENMEARMPNIALTKASAQFSSRYSRAELRRFIERQGDWALSTEGALCQADGGECMS